MHTDRVQSTLDTANQAARQLQRALHSLNRDADKLTVQLRHFQQNPAFVDVRDVSSFTDFNALFKALADFQSAHDVHFAVDCAVNDAPVN